MITILWQMLLRQICVNWVCFLIVILICIHHIQKVKASQRLSEYPNEGFVIVDRNLYCNLCDCHISWIHKSDVLKRKTTAEHGNAKRRMNESVSVSSGEGTSTSAKSTVTKKCKRSMGMGEMVSATNKKYELISDLIIIFAIADIPLQQVDAL